MDAEAVSKTVRGQYIGGPMDGGVVDLTVAPGQENFIQVQSVKTKDVPDGKPWLIHRYEIESDGPRALLHYRGYTPSDSNPLQPIGDNQ